jgi:hypothetical protein
MAEIFREVMDADTVEQAVLETLQAWMPSHLAHQEDRKGYANGTLPPVKSWPTISEFDMEVHEQMPAVFIVSAGTSDITHDRGSYRTTWRFEVGIAIAGVDEREARRLAALYLAAVKSSLVQNPTLGGAVEHCRLVGPDDHAVGTTNGGDQRAIYGTAFQVTVANSLNVRGGPSAPPADPYDPGDVPDSPLTAEFLITAVAPADTP